MAALRSSFAPSVKMPRTNGFPCRVSQFQTEALDADDLGAGRLSVAVQGPEGAATGDRAGHDGGGGSGVLGSASSEGSAPVRRRTWSQHRCRTVDWG
jgi:hypothetical protein